MPMIYKYIIHFRPIIASIYKHPEANNINKKTKQNRPRSLQSDGISEITNSLYFADCPDCPDQSGCPNCPDCPDCHDGINFPD